jgi:NAD-dependent SIR2 family protein deacetylase
MIEQAISTLRGRRAAVLTGAGISTDSGIPDYRGEGAPKAHPMTYQKFMESHRHRQRYWLGSHLGWGRFASATPNQGHRAIAAAEASSAFSGVVTQNVDALHHKAGSLRVVDLHGRLDKVRCVHCGQSFTRGAIADTIDRLNPWIARTDLDGHVRPDGDVDVVATEEFVVPRCDMCEGVLKPEVIFFGEFVPPSVFEQAAGLLARSEALVVAGSSLVVNTGMRLVSLAHKKKIPIVIINRGPTKADRMATVRIEGGTSETLGAIVEGLGL